MGVLTVQVDQARALLGQGGDCRHAAVQVSPGTTVSRHHPAHDHLPPICGPAAIDCLQRGRPQAALVSLQAQPHEPGLYNGFGRPGAHQHGVGPAAGEQLDGLDHQRLARPRLAGESGHSRPEHEAKVLDHPELAHPQFAQHGRTSAIREMELALQHLFELPVPEIHQQGIIFPHTADDLLARVHKAASSPVDDEVGPPRAL